MDLKNFLKTWEGTQAENKWSRLFIAGLLFLNCILAFQAFTKDTKVVLQPPTLSEEAWVTKNNSSRSYQESWGLYLAQLVGNATPATVGFLKDRIGPLLAPAIYSEVIEAIELQANQIENDRVSMRFEPRQVDYEESTNKVFINGYSFVKGVSGKEARTERTYEFQISVSHYQPLVDYINTYEGKPRTSRILGQIERRENIRKEREDRNNAN
ncbi:TraE/TraK family type IV conjugative transfer system protein [Eoetvoesiella caeni]